ncbi:lysine--tRNA ligase [Myxococcota bacterium]|nr:lysine--tRNA ligase [Myxococcota bacterium]
MYEFDPARLDKLQILREAGIPPYPHGLHVSHTAAQALALIGERDAAALEADPTVVTFAGRLMAKREMGKAGFGKLQDRSGELQFYVRKDDVGEETFAAWRKLDLGDHVHVTGRFMRTRTGEPSIHASALQLAAKCIAAMPDKHHGLEDRELRSRNRYVDLFVNDESRRTFQRRSAIVRFIRRWFEDRDFVEVETPMMQVIPGGAAARPFVTHHNTLGIDLYLRVAPELYLKRLVVGGFERVFEINRNFRNEGVSTKHNPEFTMLEFYQAYATWHDLMDMTEQLVSECAQAVCGTTTVPFAGHELSLSRPWRRASMGQLIAEAVGLDLDQVKDPAALRARWLQDHPDADPDSLPTTMGRWWEWYFDAHVEPGLVQPTFVTGFPAEISPLARRSDDDPRFTDRFELFIAGAEIANGFNELNDPVDQAERFAAQARAREAGDAEAMYFDADYIHALTFGLPPTAGEGIGIDRLVMLLTDRDSIRDVILFPTLRPVGAAATATGAAPAGPEDAG